MRHAIQITTDPSPKFPRIKNLPQSKKVKHDLNASIPVSSSSSSPLHARYSSFAGTNQSFIRQILDDDSVYDELDSKFVSPEDTLIKYESMLGIKNKCTDPEHRSEEANLIITASIEMDSPPLSPKSHNQLNPTITIQPHEDRQAFFARLQQTVECIDDIQVSKELVQEYLHHLQSKKGNHHHHQLNDINISIANINENGSSYMYNV